MKQTKAILLGIIVAFVFSEYIGKFLAIWIGNWLDSSGETTIDLVNAATVLGLVLGVIVYRHYVKSTQKNEQV